VDVFELNIVSHTQPMRSSAGDGQSREPAGVLPPGLNTTSVPNTTMRVDVRPHNDVKKLFITFAITFLAVHRIIDTIMTPPPKKTATADAKPKPKQCAVEPEKEPLFCPAADDTKTVEKNNVRVTLEMNNVREQKTVQYYMQNFGVVQTIEGNGEENIRMKHAAASMEDYMRRWITLHETNEILKEDCINRHDKCVFWASIGECRKNPGYMEFECMLACQVCAKILLNRSNPDYSKKDEL